MKPIARVVGVRISESLASHDEEVKMTEYRGLILS